MISRSTVAANIRCRQRNTSYRIIHIGSFFVCNFDGTVDSMKVITRVASVARAGIKTKTGIILSLLGLFVLFFTTGEKPLSVGQLMVGETAHADTFGGGGVNCTTGGDCCASCSDSDSAGCV